MRLTRQKANDTILIMDFAIIQHTLQDLEGKEL